MLLNYTTSYQKRFNTYLQIVLNVISFFSTKLLDLRVYINYYSYFFKQSELQLEVQNVFHGQLNIFDTMNNFRINSIVRLCRLFQRSDVTTDVIIEDLSTFFYSLEIFSQEKMNDQANSSKYA